MTGPDVIRYFKAGAVGIVSRIDPEQPVPPPVICPGSPSEDYPDTATINLELGIHGVR